MEFNRSRARHHVAVAYWFVRYTLGLAPRHEFEALAHLSWVRSKVLPKAPGEFCAHFGTVRYVDISSFSSQFLEMFINRIYNYEAHEVAPFILDCGGNIGLSTIWFKLRFPQAHVTVFEADPLIAEVLETNLKRLNLGDVEVVRAAAWVENGSVSFCSDGADQGRVTKDSNSQRVVAIRLADRIQQPVDLLKMDIEGSEYEVIGDLAESGKLAQIRRLICEVHGVHRNRYLVSDLLSSLAHFQHNITISTLPTTQSQRWAS